MRAAICTKHGPPDVLQITEIEKPLPQDNQVLVKIVATTVTVGDTVLRRQTFLQFLLMWPLARLFFGIKNQRKKILGHEFSGVVEAVGKDVTAFKSGEYVFGTTGFSGGAYAEYICLPEDAILTSKPVNMTFEEAAAVPIGGICALYFLRKGNIQHGKNILIYGASGSIGTYAVQLATLLGAKVTGVCSTQNIELVKSLGVKNVIDYTREDFTKNGKSYDLIFDTVGKISASRCKSILKKNGTFVSTHSSPVKENIDDLIFLKEQIESGKMKSIIDRKFPLQHIVDAHRYVDQGHKRGNVVITHDEIK